MILVEGETPVQPKDILIHFFLQTDDRLLSKHDAYIVEITATLLIKGICHGKKHPDFHW